MYNSTLNTLSTLIPLDINGFITNNICLKESIVSINKNTQNCNRQGITFIDKPDRYIAVLNVAGFDKSEIKITEEKTAHGYSVVNVGCHNQELTKINYLFSVPLNANLNTIKSVLKNGLLTVSCEIKNQKPKQVSIEIE
jgi:HSP20 family molecular chaperone IbpA